MPSSSSAFAIISTALRNEELPISAGRRARLKPVPSRLRSRAGSSRRSPERSWPASRGPRTEGIASSCFGKVYLVRRRRGSGETRSVARCDLPFGIEMPLVWNQHFRAGEPHFRELEPDVGLAEVRRLAQSRGSPRPVDRLAWAGARRFAGRVTTARHRRTSRRALSWLALRLSATWRAVARRRR